MLLVRQISPHRVLTVKLEEPYEFAASRLIETTNRADGTFYDSPVHVAEKTWISIDFDDMAWRLARGLVERGRYRLPQSRAMLHS
jgi:hypothetical protein